MKSLSRVGLPLRTCQPPRLPRGGEGGPHHHEPLQQLAGRDEVAAADLQPRVQALQQPLQRGQGPPLQAGLQDPLQEHLVGTLLEATGDVDVRGIISWFIRVQLEVRSEFNYQSSTRSPVRVQLSEFN